MALRKDRGLRVDDSICILGLVVDIPLKEDVVGHVGAVRKDLGRSSVVIWIRRWMGQVSVIVVLIPVLVWLETRNEWTEIDGIK